MTLGGQSDAARQEQQIKKNGVRRDKQEREEKKDVEKFCGLSHDTWASRGLIIVMGEL